MGCAHFPAAFRALICRASQEGSLLERSPLPKKPLRQRMAESRSLVTHTERVAGSNMPSQRGFSSLLLERPRRPRTWPALLCVSGGAKTSGRGCAYILLFSARRAPLFWEPLCLLGAAEDMRACR